MVVLNDNRNSEVALGVSIGANTTKSAVMPFSIEKATNPIPEIVTDIQPGGDAIALNSTGESILNTDLIYQSVSFSDAFTLNTCGLRDFSIRKASKQQFALSLLNGGVNFTVDCVGHLYISNEFGSLVRYDELYTKAEREANATQSKQELGIPDLVKHRLKEDGWICRSTIIWHKPNPMPESVTDRPTKSHEYVFLFAKEPRYYYDADAIAEPVTSSGGNFSTVYASQQIGHGGVSTRKAYDKRNKRSVWTIPTKPNPEAHFATFPPDLITPMILAGCPVGGVVLDPFMGSGTTALVARKLGRRFIGSELNADYAAIANRRLAQPFTPSFMNILDSVAKDTAACPNLSNSKVIPK